MSDYFIETTTGERIPLVPGQFSADQIDELLGRVFNEDVGGGVFWAEYGVTTSAEIEAAYQAGQAVAILYDNKIGYLINSSATGHTFAVLAPYDTNFDGIPINILSCYDNRWGGNVLEAENTANKINTITATSDGTQYPSARAVIDYVDNQIKTFEAIFNVTTSEEIEAAYQGGKTITMNNNGVIYYLRERVNSQFFVFTTAPYYLDIFQEINIYTATCNNSSWSMATTKAEPISNKVTIIDANSTNKQYPSAKAVFDYVQNNSGGGGSGADLLNENGVIKQQYFPEGYPYSEDSEGIVLPETTIVPMGEMGEAPLTETLGLIEGQTYRVNWNGTDYECVCSKVEVDGDGDGVVDTQIGLGIGNIGIVTGENDTGEPFVIIELAPEFAAEMGVPSMVQIIDGSTSVTLSITGTATINTPIAQKFLPKGYPYFVPGGEVVFPETTVNLPYEGEYNITLKAGYTYTVNWNGTDYACEATAFENEDVGFVVALGNGAVYGGEPTDDPFTILRLVGMAIIFSDESAATLSITQADSYLRLDERYLPRSVENTLAEANKAVAKVEEVAADAAAKAAAKATADKADKADPVFVGSISLGRVTGETVGAGSIAVGKYVVAQGETSQAFGYRANATGDYAHAEGYNTVASGRYAYAQGRDAVAGGEASHTEGNSTEASGEAAHAEGRSTKASGFASHAEGLGTEASGYASHAQGKYNIQDTQGKYAHIVGNGQNGENRSNAHTLDWKGNAWFAGTVEGTGLILKSSTAGSSKRFLITVDDSGTLSATEVTT